jgi:hypothetical protein
MRASPAFQITVCHFGAWRSAIAVLLLCAVSTLAAFALADGESAPPLVRSVALLASAAVVLAGSGLMRCRPVSLRWDTHCWNLGPGSSVGEEPWPGRLEVTLDLGAWMLLRFEHEVTAGRRRSSWVPVQRRGMESAWHGFRCAVYSARSARGTDHGQRLGASSKSQE